MLQPLTATKHALKIILFTVVSAAFLCTPLVNGVPAQVLGQQIDAEMLGSPLMYETILTRIEDPTPVPTRVGTSGAPVIDATSAIVLDRSSHKVLYEKEADTFKMPASTTKLLTAYVSKNNLDLNAVVTVPNNLFTYATGSMMGLQPGEQITVDRLIKGLLIASGNDAAYVLAQALPGGMTEMMEKMNQASQSFGNTESNFTNPYGYEDPNHLTNARELARIIDQVLADEYLFSIAGTKQISIPTSQRSISLINTVQPLGNGTVVAGKTGWTEKAEGVLATISRKNGHEIITVVMNSNQRETDSMQLINWTYTHFTW